MGKNFLELPSEMRNQIYKEHLKSIPPAPIQFFGHAKTITKWMSPACTRSDKYNRLPCPTSEMGGPLALTLVNRQIHEEVQGLVHDRAYTFDVDHDPNILHALAPDGIQTGFPDYQYPDKKDVKRLTITNVAIDNQIDDISKDVKQQILAALIQWSLPLIKDGKLPPVVDLIGRRGEVMNLRVNKVLLDRRKKIRGFEFVWGRMYADCFEFEHSKLRNGRLEPEVKTYPRFGRPLRTYPIFDGHSLSDVRGIPGYVLCLTVKNGQAVGPSTQDPAYRPRLDFSGELQRLPCIDLFEDIALKDTVGEGSSARLVSDHNSSQVPS